MRLIGPREGAETLAWLGPIADALDFAHRSGVLHRDVKPGNVLFTSDGRPVLSDFGIARLAQSTTRLTATGTIVGTPTYMAPELARGQAASAASDQYALGVLAWEALVGDVPFDGENPLSVLHQQVTEPVPALQRRSPELPIALQTPFDRVLAKAPADRFESCRAFLEALAAVLGEELPSWPTAVRGTARTRIESEAPTELRPSPDEAESAAGLATADASSTYQIRSWARALAVPLALVVAALLGAFWRWPNLRPEPTLEAAVDPGPPPPFGSVDPTADRPVSEPVPPPIEPGPPGRADAPTSPPAGAGPEPGPARAEPPPEAPAATAPPAGGGGRPGERSVVPGPRLEKRADLPRGPEGGRPGAIRQRLEMLRYPPRRLARQDFTDVLALTERARTRFPGDPNARSLRRWAEGGVAYASGDDPAAAEAIGDLGRQRGDLPDSFAAWAATSPERAAEPWRLAVAFGDARGEGLAAVEKNRRGRSRVSGPLRASPDARPGRADRGSPGRSSTAMGGSPSGGASGGHLSRRILDPGAGESRRMGECSSLVRAGPRRQLEPLLVREPGGVGSSKEWRHSGARACLHEPALPRATRGLPTSSERSLSALRGAGGRPTQVARVG